MGEKNPRYMPLDKMEDYHLRHGGVRCECGGMLFHPLNQDRQYCTRCDFRDATPEELAAWRVSWQEIDQKERSGKFGETA